VNDHPTDSECPSFESDLYHDWTVHHFTERCIDSFQGGLPDGKNLLLRSELEFGRADYQLSAIGRFYFGYGHHRGPFDLLKVDLHRHGHPGSSARAEGRHAHGH